MHARVNPVRLLVFWRCCLIACGAMDCAVISVNPYKAGAVDCFPAVNARVYFACNHVSSRRECAYTRHRVISDVDAWGHNSHAPGIFILLLFVISHVAPCVSRLPVLSHRFHASRYPVWRHRASKAPDTLRVLRPLRPRAPPLLYQVLPVHAAIPAVDAPSVFAPKAGTCLLLPPLCVLGVCFVGVSRRC